MLPFSRSAKASLSGYFLTKPWDVLSWENANKKGDETTEWTCAIKSTNLAKESCDIYVYLTHSI